MKIGNLVESIGMSLFYFLPVICVAGTFMVPIIILDGLEQASRNNQDQPRGKKVMITELVQTTERFLDGYCDVTRADGNRIRVFEPINDIPYGEQVSCTGHWLERPTTRRVTKYVFQ